MGIAKMLFWSVFGPFLIWLVLVGHVVYQVAFKPAGPIKTTGWPEGVDDAMKATLIANRKFILKDFMDLLKPGNQDKIKPFIANRLTEDFEFEDPMEKFVGKDEFTDFLYICKYIQDIEFNVFGEHHSTHEMIMDWSLKFTMTFLPSVPITIPMRTHFLLEPAEQAGSGEKLFKIFEEWYGNEHLNERTAPLPVLGTVHSQLRRYVGILVTWIAQLDKKYTAPSN